MPENGDTQQAIPVFLSVDVEPDGFQLSESRSNSWSGINATIDVMNELRPRLAQVTGHRVAAGWYIRTDPQIAQAYGSGDALLTHFAPEIQALRNAGDYVGVHSHPVRWSDAHRAWIHDFANVAWNAECAETALEAFANAMGSRARHFRVGASFIANEVIAAIERGGVKVEMALEPVAPWPADFDHVPTGADETAYVGAHVDSQRAPQVAYRPSADDFRVPGGHRARGLHMVPMTTMPYLGRGARWRPRLRALLPKRFAYERRVLHLSAEWPSGEYYWNLVASQVEPMRRPYVSIAMRTDPPGSAQFENAIGNLRALLDHPFGRRLRFVDPLEALQTLEA